MTPVVYRESAEYDLAAIREYFSAISHLTFNNVMADINATIAILNVSPKAGYVYKTDRRRLVSAKYRFAISYAYHRERVEIVGIYRSQNR